jgi:uncharacterized membrane protein YbhN (UPF0104 family)
MRTHVRTIAVAVLALLLLAVFLYNVDVRGVVGEILRARLDLLLLALATMPVNLAIRAWRWQYLLEPLGLATFNNAFQATAVGFAASTVLPARAGEVIRPYFLSRRERISATGAFATVIIERLLDILTVLMLLASYVFFFGRDVGTANPVAFAAMKGLGATAGGAAVLALAVFFYRPSSRRRSAASPACCRRNWRPSWRMSPKSSRPASASSAARAGSPSRCCCRCHSGCASASACGRWSSPSTYPCRSRRRSCSWRCW